MKTKLLEIFRSEKFFFFFPGKLRVKIVSLWKLRPLIFLKAIAFNRQFYLEQFSRRDAGRKPMSVRSGEVEDVTFVPVKRDGRVTVTYRSQVITGFLSIPSGQPRFLPPVLHPFLQVFVFPFRFLSLTYFILVYPTPLSFFL